MDLKKKQYQTNPVFSFPLFYDYFIYIWFRFENLEIRFITNLFNTKLVAQFITKYHVYNIYLIQIDYWCSIGVQLSSKYSIRARIDTLILIA